MSERRGASRIGVNLPVHYSSGSVSLSGRVSNLSRDGLFVQSEVLDTAGTSAVLAIALPGENNPIELTGRVVRVVDQSGGGGMGIQLVNLAHSVRRRLANFMIERSFQTRP